MPRRLCLLACLFFCTLVANAQTSTEKQIAVSLQFDYGNGFSKHYKTIRVSAGATALEAMQAMQKHPHKISYKTRGTGALTFIYEIDNVENQGSGKNWMYYVNGKRANVGVGAYQLKASDKIVWKYETFQ